MERRQSAGLGHDRGARDRHPGHAGQPAPGQPQRAGHDHPDRPDHRPERRPVARVPGTAGQTYTITKYVGVESSQDAADTVTAARGQATSAAATGLGRAARCQQGRLGGAVARLDRGPRQPHARHRRQRQRVLPVVEHARRRRLERVAGRAVLERLRRPHLLGRRDVDVSRRCSRSTPTSPPAWTPTASQRLAEAEQHADGHRLRRRALPVGERARRHRADPAAGVGQQRRACTSSTSRPTSRSPSGSTTWPPATRPGWRSRAGRCCPGAAAFWASRATLGIGRQVPHRRRHRSRRGEPGRQRRGLHERRRDAHAPGRGRRRAGAGDQPRRRAGRRSRPSLVVPVDSARESIPSSPATATSWSSRPT